MQKTIYAATVAIAGLIGAAALPQGQAQAASFTLQDLNSTMTVDTSGGGVTSWVVNGVNHMFEQWFWLRIDNTQYADREHRLSSFPTTFAQTSNTNANPGDDVLNVVYNVDDLLSVTVALSLEGTTCCGSDLGEQVSILNTSSVPLSFSFFQYTDFDLGGTSEDQSATRMGTPFGDIIQQVGFPGAQGIYWKATTSIIPTPSNWEIALWPTIRNKLDDNSATTLGNTTSPLGPGDLTWALQWDVTLDPGLSFQISKNKLLTPHVIPLPASALLLLGGLAGLGALRMRRTAA